MTVVDPDNLPGWIGKHDAREIRAFGRFLKVAGPPGSRTIHAPELAGWVPYILGDFYGSRGALLAPPEGFDDVPVTAWTFPA